MVDKSCVYYAIHFAKLYIPSALKIQMNLVTFCFLADWDVTAVLKNFAVLLKYPHVFLSFMVKTNTARSIGNLLSFVLVKKHVPLDP